MSVSEEKAPARNLRLFADGYRGHEIQEISSDGGIRGIAYVYSGAKDAERFVRGFKHHDSLVDTLKAIVDCYGCGESPEKFVEHVSGFIEDGKKLLADMKAQDE